MTKLTISINDKNIDINVIDYEKIREDRTCSKKMYKYREFDFQFQIGDETLRETLFFCIDDCSWVHPWTSESYLETSYYDDLVEALSPIIGETSEKLIESAIDSIRDVLIDWAIEKIITIYINTYDVANRFDYSDSEAEAFFCHVEEEAHKLGYYTERVCSFWDEDEFSEDFVSQLFADFIPPEDEDEDE